MALLLYGNTENPALRHEVPLMIIDPLLFAEVGDRRVVLTSHLESARVAEALPDAEILDFFDLGLRDLIQEGRTRDEATREVVARAVRRIGIEKATVPGDFPVVLADELRAAGIDLDVDDDAVQGRRRAKSPLELEGLRRAQRAAEAGMAAAAVLLRRAEPGPDGILQHGGRPLLAEHVRAALRDACWARGALCPPDVIVSSVRQGTGHTPGHGPLPASLPIQIDLWPRDEETGAWADMTRTFVVGDPAPEHAERIAEQERLVREALEHARERTRPGVTGRELFDATCDRFEAAGFRTQRTGPDPDHPSDGFQFSLGHGVGLEIHEAPGLGLAGRDPLVPGDVLAVEPGLWDHEIGGVRYEDLLLVTADGCETLTDYPYALAP